MLCNKQALIYPSLSLEFSPVKGSGTWYLHYNLDGTKGGGGGAEV